MEIGTVRRQTTWRTSCGANRVFLNIIRRGPRLLKGMLNMLLKSIIFISLLSINGAAADQSKTAGKEVSVQISPSAHPGVLFHWKISNRGLQSAFVYDFYLWGPAFRIEQTDTILNVITTPIKEEPGCPPNRFPPVLLLHVGPGRSIEGDFEDESIKPKPGQAISLTLSVGTDGYNVGEQAKQFFNSNCKHSPYDAIVRWGNIINSNSIRVP